MRDILTWDFWVVIDLRLIQFAGANEERCRLCSFHPQNIIMVVVTDI